MAAAQSVPSVAVVIPCFNGAATLGEAIASALAQEFVAEIVVVDDGSTDGSAGLAKSLGGKVRVLSGENAGVSAARNRGIAATSAPLIQFLDADDIMLPGTMALRVRSIVASGGDIVVTDWCDFRDEGTRRITGVVRSPPFDDLAVDAELSCMTRFWAPPAAILYTRDIVERAGRFRIDHRTLEDARFLYDVARAGARFEHARHLGALYRVHAGSKSRSDPVGFWLMALRKAVDVEEVWRGEGSFSDFRRHRLAEVYNGAVSGLFQAASPEYRTALAMADARGVPLSRKNRLTRLLARLTGLKVAVSATRFYSAARRRLPGRPQPDERP